MEQKVLSEVPVGTKVMVGDNTLKVNRSINGCKGCAFEKEEGARYCQLTAFCLAHNRKDKQSVIFKEV